MTLRLDRILPALILSLLTIPAIATASPAFLPDLTFPEPVQQPDVSTQGCVTTQRTVCK